MAHPIAPRVAATALIAAGGMTVVPAVFVGILNLIGFGAGRQPRRRCWGRIIALAQAAAAGGIAVAAVPIQEISAWAMDGLWRMALTVLMMWLNLTRRVVERFDLIVGTLLKSFCSYLRVIPR
ncbi:hypothetical protein C8J57DRAFT_1232375 [Mycena rebaudengoi]|nr:hypothetical protein C8J57DRAFT_1232375 [Mycena rebaudengoi]